VTLFSENATYASFMNGVKLCILYITISYITGDNLEASKRTGELHQFITLIVVVYVCYQCM
jgi:hypothetical protein